MSGIDVQISKEITIIRNSAAQAQYTLKTENAFGIIYNSLEKHFPDFDNFDLAQNIINSALNGIAEIGSATATKNARPVVSYKLLGQLELGDTLDFFKEYFENKTAISFSIQEVDALRIRCYMRASYLPLSINDPESMSFDALTNVKQVMVALLFYYAYRGYKMVKCRHCGRWFATHSLKNQYCKQVSPCCVDVLKGTAKTCEQAVRQITQNCTRLRNAIRTKVGRTTAAQLYVSDFSQAFEEENAVLEQAAREAPTVANLTAYYYYLKQINKSRGWTGGESDAKHNKTGK